MERPVLGGGSGLRAGSGALRASSGVLGGSGERPPPTPTGTNVFFNADMVRRCWAPAAETSCCCAALWHAKVLLVRLTDLSHCRYLINPRRRCRCGCRRTTCTRAPSAASAPRPGAHALQPDKLLQLLLEPRCRPLSLHAVTLVRAGKLCRLADVQICAQFAVGLAEGALIFTNAFPFAGASSTHQQTWARCWPSCQIAVCDALATHASPAAAKLCGHAALRHDVHVLAAIEFVT